MTSAVTQPKETPFAIYLKEEWMWKQKPPITRPAELARALDIPIQTASNWLRKGYIPEAGSLINVASKTGLSFIKLLELCGYPVPEGLVDSDRFVDFLAHKFDKERANTFTTDEVIQRIREAENEYGTQSA